MNEEHLFPPETLNTVQYSKSCGIAPERELFLLFFTACFPHSATCCKTMTHFYGVAAARNVLN